MRTARMAEIDEVKAEPDEPTSLMARREQLKALVDDWAGVSVETRRALVASIFESLRPTRDGGMIATVRPGWIRPAAAAAQTTSVNVCVYGADPGLEPGTCGLQNGGDPAHGTRCEHE